MQSEIDKEALQVEYDKNYKAALALQEKKTADKKSKQGGTKKRARREKKAAGTKARTRALGETFLWLMSRHPDRSPEELWGQLPLLHYKQYLGEKTVQKLRSIAGNEVEFEEFVRRLLSADNSWRRSSGLAFEAAAYAHLNPGLRKLGIEIRTTPELTASLKTLKNDRHDKEFLRRNKNRFDGYLVDLKKQVCFGVVQSKTSIRDRVDRDREFSIKAMDEYRFYSCAIALDKADFLKLPQFTAMVNGDPPRKLTNGWHHFFVLDPKEQTRGRIIPVDIQGAEKTLLGCFTRARDQFAQNRVRLEPSWA